MTQVTSRTFAIMHRDGSMKVPTRTHHDLKNTSTLEKAETAAQDLYNDVVSLREHTLSLDGSEFDRNDEPGEVLLEGVKYKGRTLTGSLVNDEFKMTAQGEKIRYEYSQSGDEIRRDQELPDTWYYGLTPTIKETFREAGVNSSYTVDTKYTDNPFADFQTQNHKIPRPLRGAVHNWRLERQEDGTFADSASPKLPEDIEAMASRQTCADAGNATRPLVQSLYEAAMALDGTEFDKNDREGEVLFEDFQFEGRRLNGTILPRMSARDEYFAHSTVLGPADGRSDDTKPYLRAHCSDTNETFEAVIGGGRVEGDLSTDQIHWDKSCILTYRDFHKEHSFDTVYIHDDGNRRVRVQDEKGENRSSIVVSHPLKTDRGWLNNLLDGPPKQHTLNYVREREG